MGYRRLMANLLEKKYVYPATVDKDKKLELYPHYNDRRFNDEQVVFGEVPDGISFDYDNRLREYDYKKWNNCHDSMGKYLPTARYWESFLSLYFGREVQILCIIVGINRSNGYPYRAFAYRDRDDYVEDDVVMTEE